MGGGTSKTSSQGRSSVKNEMNTATSAVTSGKIPVGPNGAKDVRRASFIPASEVGAGGQVKSTKGGDEEPSTVHADEAIKATIHNDASRRAFMKFLQKRGSGHDHVLNYYFEIEDIRASKNDDVLERALGLHSRYASFQSSAPEALRPVWKLVLDTTQPLGEDSAHHDPDERLNIILDQFKAAQTFIVSTLSPILADFYQSEVYKEFETTKGHQEVQQRPSVSAAGGAVGPSSSSQLPNNTYPKHFPKILVVDDSSVAAKVSMLALKKNGHDVKVAANGRKCIEMCQEERFDVVLVDLYMPIMDGFETMMALKATKAAGSEEEKRADKFPVVIAMSADWDKETEDKAKAAGSDSFLVKPFSVEKLSVIIVNFLPHQRTDG
jgi:CheY-like chemotaxis protein